MNATSSTSTSSAANVDAETYAALEATLKSADKTNTVLWVLFGCCLIVMAFFASYILYLRKEVENRRRLSFDLEMAVGLGTMASALEQVEEEATPQQPQNGNGDPTVDEIAVALR